MEFFKLGKDNGEYVIDVDEDEIMLELRAYHNAVTSGAISIQNQPPISNVNGWFDDYANDLKENGAEGLDLKHYVAIISTGLLEKTLDYEPVPVAEEIEPLILPDLPFIADLVPLTDEESKEQLTRSLVSEDDTPHLETADATLPPEIAVELTDYASGAFTHTIENAERINEISAQYDTLHVNVEPSRTFDYTPVLSALDELESASNAFTGQYHSSTGESLIRTFKGQIVRAREAVSTVIQTQDEEDNTQQLNNMNSAFSSLEDSYTALNEWLSVAFWQYGGKGDGDISGRSGSDTLDALKSILGY